MESVFTSFWCFIWFFFRSFYVYQLSESALQFAALLLNHEIDLIDYKSFCILLPRAVHPLNLPLLIHFGVSHQIRSREWIEEGRRFVICGQLKTQHWCFGKTIPLWEESNFLAYNLFFSFFQSFPTIFFYIFLFSTFSLLYFRILISPFSNILFFLALLHEYCSFFSRFSAQYFLKHSWFSNARGAFIQKINKFMLTSAFIVSSHAA